MPFVPSPTETTPRGPVGPFESQPIDILNNDSPHPHTKKTRQWLRCRGQISPEGGHEAHLAAVAYMSDSYFIGTVSRVHKLWRVSPRKGAKAEDDEDVLKKFRDADEAQTKRSIQPYTEPAVPKKKRDEVSMMVSLDHTIYFHHPRGFRADDWLFTEMESPWAGDGRGLVTQHIWSRDGKLIATCVQEVSFVTRLGIRFPR